jgi:hypothetical protein
MDFYTIIGLGERFSIIDTINPGKEKPAIEIRTRRAGQEIKYRAEDLTLPELAQAMQDLYLQALERPLPKPRNPEALTSAKIDFRYEPMDKRAIEVLSAISIMDKTVTGLIEKLTFTQSLLDVKQAQIDRARRELS